MLARFVHEELSTMSNFFSIVLLEHQEQTAEHPPSARQCDDLNADWLSQRIDVLMLRVTIVNC